MRNWVFTVGFHAAAVGFGLWTGSAGAAVMFWGVGLCALMAVAKAVELWQRPTEEGR